MSSALITVVKHDGSAVTLAAENGGPEELGAALAGAPFWENSGGRLEAPDEDGALAYLTGKLGARPEGGDADPEYRYLLDLASYAACGYGRRGEDPGSRRPFYLLCALNPGAALANPAVAAFVRAAAGFGPEPDPAEPGNPAPLKWVARYFAIAELVATWSKDPSTKVGAIIVGDKGQIISQGYNGFPRGVSDSAERYADREIKYRFVVHAEMNAILNALYNGSSVVGASIYIHNLPVCQECAKAIIQSGIARVFIDREIEGKWLDAWQFSKTMFREAGVRIYKYDRERGVLQPAG